MDDRVLSATILRVSDPQDIERVELCPGEKVAHVWMGKRAGTCFVCPECGDSPDLRSHLAPSSPFSSTSAVSISSPACDRLPLNLLQSRENPLL